MGIIEAVREWRIPNSENLQQKFTKPLPSYSKFSGG
jgi:hypothetical protein